MAAATTVNPNKKASRLEARVFQFRFLSFLYIMQSSDRAGERIVAGNKQMLLLFAAFVLCFSGAAMTETFHHAWILTWLVIMLVGGLVWYWALYVREAVRVRGNPRRVDWHVDTLHVNFYVALFFAAVAYLFFSLTLIEAIGTDEDGYSPLWALARDGSAVNLACFVGMAFLCLLAVWVAWRGYGVQRERIREAHHSLRTQRDADCVTLDDDARIVLHSVDDYSAFIQFLRAKKAAGEGAPPRTPSHAARKATGAGCSEAPGTSSRGAPFWPHPTSAACHPEEYGGRPFGSGEGSRGPPATTGSRTPAARSGVSLEEVLARIDDRRS